MMLGTLTGLARAASPLQVSTPLEPGTFELRAIEGREGISTLFHYELDLFSRNPAIDPARLLGRHIAFSIQSGDEKPRRFHGICSRFSQARSDGDGASYNMEVVPQLWLLSLNRDSRIYQDRSLPEIIDDVLKMAGLAHAEFQFIATHRTHEFAVQYNESSLDFLMRRAQREGIYYFFIDNATTATLVLSDDPMTHPTVGSPTSLEYRPSAKPAPGAPLAAHELTHVAQYGPGKVTLNDYAFQTPSASLIAQALKAEPLPGEDAIEIYDYPGAYAQRADGRALAQIRLEQEALRAAELTGASNAPHLASGRVVTFTRHPNERLNGEYLLTSVQHTARLNESGQVDYTNTFTCIPAAVPYRPPYLAPLPIGPTQTAVVVSPGAGARHYDQYGRVKVRFHWDRVGQPDSRSSVWIRVAQMPAAGAAGAYFMPEVGDEVLVAFEHGDVDRPLIVGKVWNPLDPPPGALFGATADFNSWQQAR